MKLSDEVKGAKWVQKVDPQDKRFVVITIRIPNGGMPTATYSGAEAVDRLVRFCRGFLAGADLAAKGDAGDA